MYISLNWIQDYVDLSGIDLDKLLNQFTLSVAEIEGVEHKGANLSGVVTAKIVSVEPHPNSKKLHVLKVDTGKPNLTDVVCGAPNCRVGLVVPFATLGANVDGTFISRATLAGVESCGMCCSGKELGISDNHDGLLELPDNTPLGVDIKKLLPIEDIVFEVDNKSLTNRPDLWGHYGIAREIAALVKRPLKKLDIAPIRDYQNKPALDIGVTAPACLRYCGLTVDNITQKMSNSTMQLRLFYAGMRPINLLTDLTNYLMLELGQPMHAFDNEKVKNIQVLNIKTPTDFLTLDGITRKLPAETMVIATNQQPVAVAGIMGGELSGISESTHRVLIESATFDSMTIRKTATALGLRSEASVRYEKTLDPELTLTALGRYVHLLQQADPEIQITSRVTDVYKTHYEPVSIDISKAYIDRYVGIEIPEKTILDILQRLNFQVTPISAGQYRVLVPTYRATKDIKIPADLVEEITRIYGYDNITPKSTLASVEPVAVNPIVEKEYRAKYLLAAKYNFSEVHTQIWYDSAANAELGIAPKSVVKLVNALQKENSDLRQTLLPSLLKVALENKNQYDQFGIFEIGRVAHAKLSNNLVEEKRKLGIVSYEKPGNMAQQLQTIKEALQALCENELNLTFAVQPSMPTVSYVHPINHYTVLVSGIPVGEIGLLHPTVKNRLNSACEVAFAEVDFDLLASFENPKVKFAKVTKYPVSEYDFSFVVPADMLYADLQKIAKSMVTPLQFEVSYVDVFALNKTQKVLTIKVHVWSLDHTLTTAELDEFYRALLQAYEQKQIFVKTAV